MRLAPRGAEGGGKVENLPTHVFTSDDGDLDTKCPTEIGITDRREAIERQPRWYLILAALTAPPMPNRVDIAATVASSSPASVEPMMRWVRKA